MQRHDVAACVALTLDHVVCKIVDGTQVRARRRGSPFRDDAAIEFGPLHGVVMRVHVRAALLTRGIERCLPIQQNALQDRVAEAPRAGMDQDIGMVAVEPGLGGDVRFKDFLDGLEFAKMVAAADAAKRGIKGGSGTAGVDQDTVDVAVPRLIERVQPLGQLVEPQLARSGIELKQPHAAADVGADQLRVNAISQNGAADGTIFAGMEIRHSRDCVDAGQSSDLLELKRGVTLDPGFGRGEDVDRRAAVHLGRSAHLKAFRRLRIVGARNADTAGLSARVPKRRG